MFSRNYFRYSVLFAAIVSVFYFISCGSKNSENTEMQKTENQTETQTMTQSQTTTTNNTQQMDTTKPKTDTTEQTKKENDRGKESNIVVLETSMGDITIELYPKDAPKHCANFKKLVNEGFYDGTAFHRVIPGFMIQGGDPNSKDDDRSNDGLGGPGYTIPAEIKLKHELGSVAAARLGDQVNPKRESSGSQFYIVVGDASHLDGQYTVFGKVIKGEDVAINISKVKRDARDNPLEKVEIKRAYFGKK
jgi:cyclophilin family peptidyl-prolyl cis-trans isomerase